jgi:hypothetical protein
MSLILLGWFLIVLVYLFIYLVGTIIETKLHEETRIKKFWRKHILAPDPNEPEDGETRY